MAERMNISWSNRFEINKLYIHDSIFEGYTYSYDTEQILLTCENYFINKVFVFTFNNVIFHSTQSCAFWGNGSSILNVHLVEGSIYDVQMMEVMNSVKKYNRYERFEEYIQIAFELNSGGVCFIICQSVDYQESPLSPEKIAEFHARWEAAMKSISFGQKNSID